MSETAPVATPTAQAEAPAVEGKTEQTATPVEKPSSGKLLDFAKKEAEFAKKEVARKEEIAKLQSQLKSFEEEVNYFRKAKDTYKQDPEALLAKLGISYDDLTNSILDYYDNKDKNSKPPDADTIRKEIEAQFQQKEQERIAKETQAAVENFSKEITKFVADNKENFPHLTQLYKPFGQTETPEEFIFSIVENYFEETGELIDLQSAAATAEEYFREEWNKLNGVLTGKPVETKPPETKTEKIVQPQSAAPAVVNAPTEINSQVLNHNAFTRKEAPTITNNFAKPSARVPYKGSDNARKDVIEKAVRAMEEAARRPR